MNRVLKLLFESELTGTGERQKASDAASRDNGVETLSNLRADFLRRVRDLSRDRSKIKVTALDLKHNRLQASVVKFLQEASSDPNGLKLRFQEFKDNGAWQSETNKESLFAFLRAVLHLKAEKFDEFFSENKIKKDIFYRTIIASSTMDERFLGDLAIAPRDDTNPDFDNFIDLFQDDGPKEEGKTITTKEATFSTMVENLLYYKARLSKDELSRFQFNLHSILPGDDNFPTRFAANKMDLKLEEHDEAQRAAVIELKHLEDLKEDLRALETKDVEEVEYEFAGSMDANELDSQDTDEISASIDDVRFDFQNNLDDLKTKTESYERHFRLFLDLAKAKERVTKEDIRPLLEYFTRGIALLDALDEYEVSYITEFVDEGYNIHAQKKYQDFSELVDFIEQLRPEQSDLSDEDKFNMMAELRQKLLKSSAFSNSQFIFRLELSMLSIESKNGEEKTPKVHNAFLQTLKDCLQPKDSESGFLDMKYNHLEPMAYMLLTEGDDKIQAGLSGLLNSEYTKAIDSENETPFKDRNVPLLYATLNAAYDALIHEGDKKFPALQKILARSDADFKTMSSLLKNTQTQLADIDRSTMEFISFSPFALDYLGFKSDEVNASEKAINDFSLVKAIDVIASQVEDFSHSAFTEEPIADKLLRYFAKLIKDQPDFFAASVAGPHITPFIDRQFDIKNPLS